MTEPRKFLTIGGVDRREFLTRSGGLVTAALLVACESRGPKSAEKLLRYAERKNLVVERALYRHTAMDKVQSARTTAARRFPVTISRRRCRYGTRARGESGRSRSAASLRTQCDCRSKISSACPAYHTV